LRVEKPAKDGGGAEVHGSARCNFQYTGEKRRERGGNERKSTQRRRVRRGAQRRDERVVSEGWRIYSVAGLRRISDRGESHGLSAD
jgi:hypothetical protein